MDKLIKRYLLYFFAGFIIIAFASFFLPLLATRGGEYGLIFGIIGFVALVIFIVLFTTKKMVGSFMAVFPSVILRVFHLAGKVQLRQTFQTELQLGLPLPIFSNLESI